MQCPHCDTENRDDRASCYQCGRDLTLLRLISNKARSHFNTALDHIENARYYEALGELNSAVELNSRFIEAHVLRGSILARLERSEEAREALHKALALRPQAARAHKYLRELEDVHHATPLRMRLQKLALGAAGALAVGAVLAVGGIAMMAKGPGPIREGWAALGRGDIAESRRKAAEARPGDPAADELTHAVNLAVQTRLDAAKRMSETDRSAEAVALLRELEGMRLPPDLAAAVKRQREYSAGEAADHFAREVAASAFDAAGREALETRRAELAMLFPDAKERLDAELAKRQATEQAAVEALLAEARAALSDPTAGARVTDLLARAEAQARDRGVTASEAVQAVRAEVSRARAEQLLAQATEAAAREDRAAFGKLLEELERVSPAQKELVARAEALEAGMRERERARLAAALDAALAAGEAARILADAEALERSGAVLDGDQAKRVAEARRSVALESYYALMKMADRFERGELTVEQAREALGTVTRARGPLPPRLADKAAENLHFFAAVAQRAAGRTEEAEREIAALREAYPKSGWLLAWERQGTR